jgi:transmembrane sensor
MRDPIDDVAIERMWRGVAERRGKMSRVSRTSARGVLLAAASFAVMVALVLVWRVGSREIGPLHLSSGAPVVQLSAATEAHSFAFEDGSHIDLAAGATFAVRENSGHVFNGKLRDGMATFDVRPGGPRRWTIDCDLATVEVIGTRFVIEAAKGRVSVHVERGHVRVRNAGQLSDLLAGESVEIVAPPSPSGLAMAPPVSPATSADPPAPVIAAPALPSPNPTPTAARPPATSQASWQSLARGGDFGRAYDALGPSGIARVTPMASVDELLALADVARLSGHPSDSAAPLRRIVEEHAGDARAPLAAFTLGRIELDALGHPGRAADAFSRALDLGLPAGLAEDGYARLVEARVKAGDRAGAEAAFAAYRRAFPRGTRSTTMRRWLGGDEGDSRSPLPSLP